MIRDLSSKLLTGLLFALLLWAPVPFASVTPAGRFGLQLAVAMALLLAAGCRGGGWRGVSLPTVALLLVAAWGWAQSLPLPTAAVARLSPQAAELHQRAARLAEHPPPARLPLSLAPDLSRRNAAWWAAMAAALAAAAVCGRHRTSRRALALGLLAAAIFQVLYGTRHWTAGGSEIWGTPVPGSGPRLRGTFVNPNHLALYLTLSLAVAAAWIWWSARRARSALGLERRLLLLAPPLLLWLALFASIGFTGSRAGMLAALAATAVQGLAMALPARRWRLALAGVALSLLGMGVVAAIGLQQGLGRWLATTPLDVSLAARRAVYAASFELWRRFPWTGTGMATFRDSFPMVQPQGVDLGWWHAHNDWLEALVTLGVLGAALLLAGLVALLARLLLVLRGNGRSEDRAAALAGLGALAAVAVCSALDFGLTVPANALTVALLLGAAAGTPGQLRRWSRPVGDGTVTSQQGVGDSRRVVMARQPGAPRRP